MSGCKFHWYYLWVIPCVILITPFCFVSVVGELLLEKLKGEGEK